MKYSNIIILVISLVSAINTAQEVNLSRTNKLFSNQAYVEAAASYEQHKRTEDVLTNLGDAYYYIGNLEKAEKTYTELTKTYGTIQDRDRIYRYAQSLLAAKKFKEADEFLGYYHGRYYNTEQFSQELKSSKPHNFEVYDMTNAGSYGDFGMRFVIYDKVVFASSRNLERPVYSWNGLPYLDLYTASINAEGTLANIVPLKGTVNTDLHESNAVVTKDGLTMYFNRNSEDRFVIDDKKVSVQRLYKAHYRNGMWTDEALLPFASVAFSTQHPALSSDEKTLYFASDMPGGFGKLDIYRVAINPDGTYGTPENLGSKINTEQLDQFPYISNTNTLYYATNGKQGYGGLDIFRSDMVNGVFTVSNNLGSDINTAKDDHSYIVDENKNVGYFSSDRTGIDRLYGFKRSENILSKFLVQGFVKNKETNQFLKDAQVTLMDEQGNIQQDTIVDGTAKFNFRVDVNKSYILRATLKGYAPAEELFTTNGSNKKSKDILLSLEKYDVVAARIKENEKGDLLVNLDKIYFDYNSAVIRDDAAVILEDLVRIMNTYPDMKIEVAAHTDSRGPNAYNLDLSKQRAAAVVTYLKNRNIKETRLRSIGYGEEQPLNKCLKDSDCTEAQHESNRRSEFKILD